ncbi:Major Facilitator Superfamily [Aspergillus sclerotialis]|uniref:Major Facilitator Superfamily n=1 Tax=Aspergillus sclerotialis TaxID=2070753 RepID=A0A3A3A2T7_9EURO|nr:Major Facilitator Superfamily [Aspergillus sclerotialis]
MSTPPEQPPPAYSETEREQMSVADTPQSIPRVPLNGGWRAWASVAGASLLQFCSLGYVNACMIFQLHYKKHLWKDRTPSSLAWITTIHIFLLFGFGPSFGLLYDIHGRRMVPLCCVFAVFSVGMLAFAKEYWEALISRCVLAAASAGLYLPAVAVTTQWFPAKKGLALGIVAAGSSLGGIIYPCILPAMIRRFGFADAVITSGFIQVILMLIDHELHLSPFPPLGKRGWEEKSRQRRSRIRVSNSWPWMLFASGCFFTMWGLWVPINRLQEVATLPGRENFAYYIVAIANTGSLVGCIVQGWTSDIMGQFNAICLVTSFTGIITLVFWPLLEQHMSLAGLIPFALLYGFVSGGFMSIGPACVVALAGDRVEEMIGVKLGGFCLAIALGVLTVRPIENAVRDRERDKSVGLMCFAGASMLLGAAFMVATRVAKGGSKLLKKV